MFKLPENVCLSLTGVKSLQCLWSPKRCPRVRGEDANAANICKLWCVHLRLLVELMGTQLCLKFVYDWFNMIQDSSMIPLCFIRGRAFGDFLGAILEMQDLHWCSRVAGHGISHCFMTVLAGQGHASASWRPPMCERQHSRRPTLFCSNFSGKAGEDAVVQTFAGSVQTEFFSASICHSRILKVYNWS